MPQPVCCETVLDYECVGIVSFCSSKDDEAQGWVKWDSLLY
jgi:hypothetical protein